MRGAILCTILLAASLAPQVRAATPPGFKPPPPVRTSTPYTPRPIPVARPPHCPTPPPKPIAVSTPKPTHYTRRSMDLVQQNIIMMSAMRASAARRCDPSWSAEKLRRKGCPLAPEPARDAPSPPSAAPGTTIATASDPTDGEN